jgi:hypothetical protein
VCVCVCGRVHTCVPGSVAVWIRVSACVYSCLYSMQRVCAMSCLFLVSGFTKFFDTISQTARFSGKKVIENKMCICFSREAFVKFLCTFLLPQSLILWLRIKFLILLSKCVINSVLHRFSDKHAKKIFAKLLSFVLNLQWNCDFYCSIVLDSFVLRLCCICRTFPSDIANSCWVGNISNICHVGETNRAGVSVIFPADPPTSERGVSLIPRLGK